MGDQSIKGFSYCFSGNRGCYCNCAIIVNSEICGSDGYIKNTGTAVREDKHRAFFFVLQAFFDIFLPALFVFANN